MSAWIVSKSHIDALLWAAQNVEHGGFKYRYGGDWHELVTRLGRRSRLDELGEELRRVNIASVAYRYQDSPELIETMMPDDMRDEYRYEEPAVKPTPVETIKNVHCFAYQSCENEELWGSSEAKAFTDRLLYAMTSEVPGYGQAPWGWDEGNVARYMAQPINRGRPA